MHIMDLLYIRREPRHVVNKTYLEQVFIGFITPSPKFNRDKGTVCSAWYTLIILGGIERTNPIQTMWKVDCETYIVYERMDTTR